MYEFCTLFDSAYLPRAVVLARSLAATCPSFCLRAFCMDEKAHELLDALALPGVVSIGPGELEAADPELRSVKARRTRAEYCWTATPAVCLQSLEREPVLEAITYLDADLMFFADPHAIFDELGRGSILLTAHRHTRRRGQGAPPEGIFNVQFITFRRDEHGLAALRWWRERCLERCELAPEDGVWGDQKYLDDWPERFGGVHVLEHPGALGPWNVASHALEQQGESVLTDGVRLVFFHFTAFDLYRGLASLRRLGLLKRQLQLAREPIPLGQRPPDRRSGARPALGAVLLPARGGDRGRACPRSELRRGHPHGRAARRRETCEGEAGAKRALTLRRACP